MSTEDNKPKSKPTESETHQPQTTSVRNSDNKNKSKK